MKRIFFLLLFLTNLYSALYDKDHIPYKIHLYTKDTIELCGYKAYYFAKYNFVSDDLVDKFEDVGSTFEDGTRFLKHLFKCKDGWQGYEVWIIDGKCEDGKVWNFEKNECSCPSNKEWNGSKCIGLNDCPEGETLYNGECISPNDLLDSLLSSEQKDYYNNHCNMVYHQASFNGDNSVMVCTADIYCDKEFVQSILVSCGQTSDNSSSTKEVCDADKELVIINGQVNCMDMKTFTSKFIDSKGNLDSNDNSENNDNKKDNNNENNNNNSNIDSNNDNINDDSNINANIGTSYSFSNYSSHYSDNSNNNENKDSSDDSANSDGGANNSDSSDDSGVNCCAYYKSGHGTWTLVDGCLDYTIPETGQHCRIKDDGLKCYSCVRTNDKDKDNSNNYNNLSQISGILRDINNNSKSINDTLKNIIDIKPENNYGENSKLSSTEEFLFSGFTEAIDNTKNSLNDLVNSFNRIKELISHPKEFTLFNQNIHTCPIISRVYNHEIKVDICSFISPYKPILQLFFTLLFSLSVIFYFFDVILKGDNK